MDNRLFLSASSSNMISRSEKLTLIARAILYIISVTLYCLFREIKHRAKAALPNLHLFFKHTATATATTTTTTTTTSHIFFTVDGSPSLSPIPNHIVTKAINLTLPIIRYGESTSNAQDTEDAAPAPAEACVVCWECVQPSDEIRDLPNCRHVFHRDCLDRWVDQGQITCPLCRSMLLPPLTNPWAVVRQEQQQQEQQQQQQQINEQEQQQQQQQIISQN